MKKEKRLNEIHEFLWSRGGSGATLIEISHEIGLSSLSHVQKLVATLTKQGKAVRQRSLHSHLPGSYFAAHTSINEHVFFENTTPLYSPIDNWVFDNNHCFLCGDKLNSVNASDEHVIPKWMQNHYQLWDQRLGLLNGTEIPYRQLIIPCCKLCNSNYLSNLENTIRTAHSNGFDQFAELPRIVIFQWLSKVFYGLLFREMSLLHDRRDPTLGYIFSEEQLRDFGALHHFLQSVRLPFVFRGFQPWSLFIFHLIRFNDGRDFDFRDSIDHMTLSFRMGEIGIIACLEDGGVQEDVLNPLAKTLQSITLHPMQFDEFAARLTYSRSLMTRTSKYMVKPGRSISEATEVILMPLMGLSNKPMFEKWNSHQYALILHQFWAKYGIPFDNIYQPPDSVRTLMFDGEQNLLQLGENGEVIKKSVAENKTT